MAANLVQRDPIGPTEQLRTVVAAFGRFIAELPDTAVIEKAWGPKEVLAHLVFWMESYVVQTNALLANQSPEPPQSSFDDLNARAVEASRGVAVDILLSRYHAASEHLCHIAQTHDPDRIVFVLKKGSAVQRSLRWYLTAEAHHIGWHQQILERQARREYLNDVEQLAQTVTAFCQVVQELPPDTPHEHVQWVQEMLARLVLWHENYVVQVETTLMNEISTAATEQRAALNTQAAALSHTTSIDALVQRFHVADERLRSLVQRLDPQNTVIVLYWERFSQVSTLDTVTARVATQISNLHRKVVRTTKRQGNPQKLS
jgi:uncharacterized protein YukE